MGICCWVGTGEVGGWGACGKGDGGWGGATFESRKKRQGKR